MDLGACIPRLVLFFCVDYEILILVFTTEEGKGSWIGAQVFAGSSVAVGGCLLVGARIAREGWGSGRV